MDIWDGASRLGLGLGIRVNVWLASFIDSLQGSIYNLG